MSRNGYEMDDDDRDLGSSELDAASQESPVSPDRPSKPRPRKRVSKASAKPAKKAAARKSLAPRKSKAPVDLADTIVIPPGRNPATKLLKAGKASKRASQNPEDHVSIPPADLDAHDERFFAEGEAASQRGEHFEAFARLKAGYVSSPEVTELPHLPVVPHERRKKLTNYVKATVAISAVLCLAALVRVGVSAGNHGTGGEKSAAAAQVSHVTAVVHAPPVVPAPVDANAQAGQHTFTQEAAPAIPLKSAHEEREDARNALEHGKAKDAIEAATRSITVDPTDAEAWLLLGAAQQETGHSAEAHTAFLECTKLAKTGNVAECRAMLQWNGPR